MTYPTTEALTERPAQAAGDSVDPFAALAGHTCLNLTTFRRNGEPVVTPVWFARRGGVLYLVTSRDSGKAKRLRRDSAVRAAPCTHAGTPLGPAFEATARLLDGPAEEPAKRALAEKYGWLFGFFGLLWRLRRQVPVFVEVVLA